MTDASFRIASYTRILALWITALTFVFLTNQVLSFWLEWPGPTAILASIGIPGFGELKAPLDSAQTMSSGLQLLLILLALVWSPLQVNRHQSRGLVDEGERLSHLADYIVRAAFWMVFLIGLADLIVSFLRIEGFLPGLIGDEATQELGRPHGRAVYVHMPMMVLSLIIAAMSKSLGFVWLALMVVIAEFQIVIARFIFSYEQAFMGDLVRFWYAALFIFASGYTLLKEGHVRVDVFYANFKPRTKAWCNVVGATLFGIPICWVILTMGFGSSSSIIASPLLSIEVSQSGYGLYVKYLMAGFLLVFAVSMMLQFANMLLRNIAVIVGQAPASLLENTSAAH